jgi:hypothetical protein
VIPYASRTGTRRNLAALRARGWRLLVSATGVHRDEGFAFAIDNGAWTAYQRAQRFDGARFVELLDRLGARADWIVVPDVVGDARASLRLTARWLPRVERYGAPMLIGVQDGMTPHDVAAWIAGGAGVFLGGSTSYKLASAIAWGTWCAERGAYFHVARVNTAKRIRLCQEARASSFDGTSATRYAQTLPLLDRARQQLHLWRASS